MEIDDVIEGIRGALDAQQLKYLIERLGQKSEREAVAIVGMACRFPGGCDTPEKLHHFAQAGGNAVGRVPAGRWSDGWGPRSDAGPLRGAFLNDIAGFDSLFFNVAPVDADYVDPQQRLLLEVSWEALEDAGLLPKQLSGSQTGVFFGMFSNDYFDLQQAGTPYCHPAAATGTQASMAAGRVSHWLNLRGPSMVVDTACSASLVAIHLACQSLLSGESNVALAGGVQLYMTSRLHVMSSVIGMVSPTGACRVMDADADGFVHGEGCGVLALKRLSDAINDGDRIHAVIRGSAINHDGRTLGLTAPNADAQEQVIRVALERANLTPADVQYVELHGSGTPLGDPCEFDALRRAFSAHPSPTPCALGSVKTNIGHTIAAAGVAGTIRGIMAMKHGMLPANPWLGTLNPNVQLQGTRFVIPTQPTAWPHGADPRRAGVSSFGASGTNAHLVLEQAPVVQRQGALHSTHALLLSAPDAQSLTAVRERWAEFLSGFEGDIADVCFTAACHRTHYRQRAAVLGRTASELALALRALVPSSQLEPRLPPRIGIVFGAMQSAQDAWTGTGSCALTVARTIERATHALETRRLGAPSPVARALIRSVATQLGVALSLRELGVEPWLCMGSGSGLLAAACFDDVVSLEQIVEAALDFERESVETGEGELALAVAQVTAPTWLRQQQVTKGTVVTGEGARPAGTQRVSADLALTSCAVWLGIGDALSLEERQALGAEPRRVLPCHSPDALLQIAVEIHCLGTEIDWRRLLTGNIVDLPRYPWQRRSHWALPARADAHVPESLLSTSASTADARGLVTPQSLVAVIAGVLGIAPEAIGPHSALAELGITSLTATQLREVLARTFDVELSPTVLWRHDTIESLERTVLQGKSSRDATSTPGATSTPRTISFSAVAKVVSSVLGVDAARLRSDTGLADLGVTSLSALELRNALERELGVSLTATALWRHETLAELAQTLSGTSPRAAIAASERVSEPELGPAFDTLDDSQLNQLLERELTACLGEAE